MGMSAPGGEDELKAEINVTPLVDVMLVLLIIFMITAPMMNSGVDIDLPQTPAKNIEDPEGKLILSIKKGNQIFLGGTAIKWAELEVKLKANERVQRESELYIEGDAQLPYAVVVTAMAVAKNAGVTKVMMLTDPADTLALSDLDKNIAPAGASQ
jgi:biopolymer transport protein TolR